MFFKTIWWHITHINVHMHRWHEKSVVDSIHGYIFISVEDLNNVPVSGDAFARTKRWWYDADTADVPGGSVNIWNHTSRWW